MADKPCRQIVRMIRKWELPKAQATPLPWRTTRPVSTLMQGSRERQVHVPSEETSPTRIPRTEWPRRVRTRMATQSSTRLNFPKLHPTLPTWVLAAKVLPNKRTRLSVLPQLTSLQALSPHHLSLPEAAKILQKNKSFQLPQDIPLNVIGSLEPASLSCLRVSVPK